MRRKIRNKPRPKFQKKLSTKVDPETGRNEYEENFLELAEKGRLGTSDSHIDALDLDFFNQKIVKIYKSRFEVAARKQINLSSLQLIARGLTAFAASSVTHILDLVRLKVSI